MYIILYTPKSKRWRSHSVKGFPGGCRCLCGSRLLPWAPPISVPGWPALPLPPLPISVLSWHQVLASLSCASSRMLCSSCRSWQNLQPCHHQAKHPLWHHLWSTATTLGSTGKTLAHRCYSPCHLHAGPCLFPSIHLEQSLPGADATAVRAPGLGQSSGPVVLGNCVPCLCGVGVGWGPQASQIQTPSRCHMLLRFYFLYYYWAAGGTSVPFPLPPPFS